MVYPADTKTHGAEDLNRNGVRRSVQSECTGEHERDHPELSENSVGLLSDETRLADSPFVTERTCRDGAHPQKGAADERDAWG